MQACLEREAECRNSCRPPGLGCEMRCNDVSARCQSSCGPDGGPGGESAGDPHLITWDGVMFDHHGAGEYVLFTNGDDLVAQTRQRPIEGSEFAENVALAVKMGRHRVAIYGDRDPALRIDGVPRSEAIVVLEDGLRVYRTSETNYYLVWPGKAEVTVERQYSRLDVRARLRPSATANMTGLLGSANGATDDEFVTREGTLLDSSPTGLRAFTDSWRVRPAESLFDYGPGQSTETFTDRAFPSSIHSAATLDDNAYASAKASCEESGAPASKLDACIVDVAAVGDTNAYAGPQLEPRLVILPGILETFEGRVGPEWRFPAMDVAPVTPGPSSKLLGPFTSFGTTLALTHLPAHARVRVSFDLHVVGPHAGDLPFVVDAVPGPRVLERRYSQPGVHRLSASFIHDGENLDLSFNWQDLPFDGEARWGLDNVEVQLER
jgi:hypothetical protein